MTLDRLSHSLGQLVSVVIVGDDRAACISFGDRVEDAAGNFLSEPASHSDRIASECGFREASLAAVSASAVSGDLTPDLTPKVSA
jgi:hypothetical protein